VAEKSGCPSLGRNDEVTAKLHALVTTDQRITMWGDNQGISFD
jgi:hypothetical protein